jgi:MYXO-CTERM domain-containing protein
MWERLGTRRHGHLRSSHVTPNGVCSARFRLAFGLCLSVGLLLGASRDAQAYCRTRTCEFRSDESCPYDNQTGCSTVGAFVFWKSSCISYAVQRDGSVKEGISAAQLGGLLDEGFKSWSEISCPAGGTPALTAQSQGPIACDAVEFNCQDPAGNSNIVMFRDDLTTSLGLRYGVIALTTITANLVSGEIFDADMEINSHDEKFVLDGPGVNDERNLHGVIDHELGHFLGLSHSRVQGALMEATYEGTTDPQSDDIAGMCAALEVGADPECGVDPVDPDTMCLGSDVSCRSSQSQPGNSGGCACRAAGSPPSNGGPWGGLGLLALGVGWGWRSRRRQTVL